VGRLVKNVYRIQIECLNESLRLVYTSCFQNIENWKSKIWSVCESDGADVERRAVKMFVVYTSRLYRTVEVDSELTGRLRNNNSVGGGHTEHLHRDT
jgi:hypothetical protein